MKRARRSLSSLRASLRVGLLVLALAAGTLMVRGAGPAWWSQRGVLNAQPADDFAVANQGQLKNIALAAFNELDAKFPGGAGAVLETHLNQWTQVVQGTRVAKAGATTDDFAAVNLGQLKYMAKPFYDRLIEIGFTEGYPWSGAPDDYALANLGQLKQVFSFDLTQDSDQDGISDLIELAQGTNPHNRDSDGDGISDGEEATLGTNPNDPDSDHDGLTDAEEIALGTRPVGAGSDDSDNDGVKDGQDAYPLIRGASKVFPVRQYVRVDLFGPAGLGSGLMGGIGISDQNQVGLLWTQGASLHARTWQNGTFSGEKTYPKTITARLPATEFYPAVDVTAEFSTYGVAGNYVNTGITGNGTIALDPVVTFYDHHYGTDRYYTLPPVVWEFDAGPPSVIPFPPFAWEYGTFTGGFTDGAITYGSDDTREYHKSLGAVAGHVYPDLSDPEPDGTSHLLNSAHPDFAPYGPAGGNMVFGTLNGVYGGVDIDGDGDGDGPFTTAVWTNPNSAPLPVPKLGADSYPHAAYRKGTGEIMAFGWAKGSVPYSPPELPTLPDRPTGTYSPFYYEDGEEKDFYEDLLPEEIRMQVKFHGPGSLSLIRRTLMNSAGDVVFAAQVFDPLVASGWRPAQLLFTRATKSLCEIPDLPWLIPNDGRGFNSSQLAVSNYGLHVPIDFVAVDEAGNATDQVMPFLPSLPSPIVSVADVTVTDVARGTDGVLRGTVRVQGTVKSAVCDTLPSDQGGVIDEAKLFVNGAPMAEATIPLAYTKSAGTKPGKPFPYGGAFVVTRPNVPITEGKNVFEVTAADQVYGIPGSGSWQVNVLPVYSTGPVVTPTAHGLSFNLPSASTTLMGAPTLTFNYTNAAGVTSPITVTPIAAGSTKYRSADGAFTIDLINAGDFRSGRRLAIEAKVTAPGEGLQGRIFHLTQNAAGGSAFAGAVASVPANASQPPDFVDADDDAQAVPQSYYTEEKYLIMETNGGEFHPSMVRVRAGPGIAEGLRVKLGQNGLTYALIASLKPGEYFLKRNDSNAPLVCSMRSLTARASFDEDALIANVQMLRQAASDFGEFELGFLIGMSAGGWEMVSGLGGIVAGALDYEAGFMFGPFLDVYIGATTAAGGNPTFANSVRFHFKTRQDSVNRQIMELGKAMPGLIYVYFKYRVEEAQMTLDLLKGKTPLAEHSEVHRFLLSAGAELLATQWVSLIDAQPRDQGYMMGRAVFEIASLIVPEAKAGKLAELTKLQFLNKLLAESNFFKVGGKGEAALQGLKSLVEGEPGLVQLLQKVSGGCFVAGTPVWTKDECKQIQDIRPGDLVLSRDSETGLQGWKPVLSVTTSHPTTLIHVRYSALSRHGGEGAGSADADDWIDDELVCTVDHPFWVPSVESGQFFPAAELSPGSLLALATGGAAVVREVWTEEADVDAPFTTYNFEVAEAHAYFVGQAGVWVHNACSPEDVAGAVQAVEKIESSIFALRRGLSFKDRTLLSFEHLLKSGDELKLWRSAAEISAEARFRSWEMVQDFATLLNAASTNAERSAILQKFPRVRDWNEKVFRKAIAAEKVETEIHHIIPEAVFKRLRQIDPWFESMSLDSLPGHAWRKSAHQEFHKTAVTGMNPALLNDAALSQLGTPKAVMDAVIEYYATHGQQQMADIVRAWCKVNDVPVL